MIALTRNRSGTDVSLPDRGWEGLTTDGHIVRIRPVTADDAGAIHSLGQRVSDRSLYLRFFSINREATQGYLTSLARPSDAGHAALVAELGGVLVALAGWERTGRNEAEVALLVEDAHQQQGIGTLLLEDLAARARAAGITALVGDVLVENHQMMKVFESSGLCNTSDQAYGVVHSALLTDLSEDGLTQVDEREAHAEAASLEPLFAPRSVAVIGAGRAPGGVGHEVLRSILRGNFTGSVHVVNPKAFEISGLIAHAHVTDVPTQIDLAIIAVPVDRLLRVLDECGAAGVRAAVVLTAGLGEAGAAGAQLQRQVLATARRHDMRLVGPNCLGLVNTDPLVRLDAWFGPSALTPGPLAIGTQSGAVGIAMADVAVRSGLGVASLVSLGNKVDVSGNDLLLRWWHDPRVRVIALYLESLGNPRKFARLARRVGAHTPILVVKGGRSAGGQRAGKSHTAAASSPDTAVDALFAQAGVLRMDTVEELIDVARLLASQQIPAGGRLAIVGNGGGAGVLAADAAAAAGLRVPPLSDALRQAIGGGLSDNPTDLGAAALPDELRRVLELIASSGEVDALLVSVTATRSNDVESMLGAVTSARLDGVTVLTNVLGAGDAPREVILGRGDTAPVYEFPESAVRALGHVVRYGQWRRTPRGTAPSLAGIQRDRARLLVTGLLDAHPGGTWLDAEITRSLLGCYGISCAPLRRAATGAAAVAAADELGYPVVVKTDLADVVHKTDVGGVHVRLADAAAVREAYDDVTSRLGGGVVIQPTVEATVELVVGVTREGTFGPIAMVGLGGVFTDLLGDRSFGLLPLTDRDPARMLRSLRAAPLLLGYRGAAPVDMAGLEDLLIRVSALASDLPEVAELDLNPVMVCGTAAVVVDAKLRVAPPSVVPDEISRSLRQ